MGDMLELVYADLDPKERAKHVLTHETFFDLQLCIEGFLALFKDLKRRHGTFSVIARKLNQARARLSPRAPPLPSLAPIPSQDPLESLLGSCARRSAASAMCPARRSNPRMRRRPPPPSAATDARARRRSCRSSPPAA